MKSALLNIRSSKLYIKVTCIFVAFSRGRYEINFDFGNKEDCIIFDHISQHRNFNKDNIVIYFYHN